MPSSEFMNETHPDAFVDFPMQLPRPEYGYTKVCPKCKGHGGWNLALNQYALREYADTPENRHMYAHFTCLCGNCMGWGHVDESQTCVHEWEYKVSVGKCLHESVCKNCGQKMIVDSSD